ncbi:hypothetical protein [Pseudofrankia sp. BMG5.36]|uniref:hypothetical protein n=1 Tax=Pseudofrankia sp. BMG5.36 TaxID=1834512 RepID=UPI0008DA9E7D|nr:hypothetical protein [Pseudofrankia sp. BMG5.36]OHV45344.1 hypothetical protein BCD48_23190 [Pseudofrankia sp. BMG5.36]
MALPLMTAAGGRPARAVTIEIGGRADGPVILPVLAPLETDGLVLTRPLGSDPADGTHRGWATVEYLPRSRLVRWAFELARCDPGVGPVAVWPHGVPAEWTTVALVVGWVLASARPVGSAPLVVCAVRPPMRKTRPALRHPVRADVGGQLVELTVWEILAPRPLVVP